MSEGIETVDIVEPWLWATLTEDAELTGLVPAGWHNSEALGRQVGVWGIYNLEDTRQVTNQQGLVIEVIAIYLVKVVARATSYDAVRPPAQRAHALLQRPGSVVTTPQGSLSCVRDTIVQYPELNDGVSYRHLGGRYRIRVSSA